MAADAAEVRKLRSELEARFGRAILPSQAPETERFDGFRTGIAAIDALLPEGVPRGAISLWTGDATGGRTAALRALVLHACAGGALVAVVDAGLTLDATFGCTPAGPVEGLWAVRPPGAGRAAEGVWAAEALLRAGVFDLVVLDGCIPDAAQGQRLRALARERNAAVVITAGKRESPSPFHRPSREQGTVSHRQARGVREEDPCSLFPVPYSLSFRADVRLEFRRGSERAGEGLMPGGRFRRHTAVALAKHGGVAPREREVEVIHEASDRLHTGALVPDRSAGRR